MRISTSVVALDPNGLITSLNAGACALLDTDAESSLGKPYPEVFGASLSDRVLRLLLRTTQSKGPSQPYDITVTLPGGRRAKLQASAGPVYGPKGVLEGFLFVADDPDAPGSDREKLLENALARYTGSQIAKQVTERPSLIGIGGSRQVVSILHADVRGYTTFAESASPEEVMSALLHYHGAAAEAIELSQGMVDRYIGDAVLALWNAPSPQEEHARLAIKGALNFQEAAARVRASLPAGSAAAALHYGVGVHTGEAVVGNLGSERYMHYTAIGDAVNIAARLQGAAQEDAIIISAQTLASAGGGVITRPLGEIVVKGRKTPVEAYLVDAVDF